MPLALMTCSADFVSMPFAMVTILPLLMAISRTSLMLVLYRTVSSNQIKACQQVKKMN